MKAIVRTAALWVIFATVVGAQSALTGKWEGKTPNGFLMVLDLVASESSLTGTFTRNGDSLPIVDGKVSKTSFTFKVPIDGHNEGMTGELNGDQITVWMDRQGPERGVTLKRSK